MRREGSVDRQRSRLLLLSIMHVCSSSQRTDQGEKKGIRSTKMCSMNRVMCLRDQIIRIQKATSCSTVVEAAVLDDDVLDWSRARTTRPTPTSTMYCPPFKIFGRSNGSALCLLQLSRSCSSLLLRTSMAVFRFLKK